MSVDHLTTASTHHLVVAVRAVLAGSDPATIVVEHGVHAADLDDAVRAYHVGGLAALEQHIERDWYDVRVEFPEWAAAETAGAIRLGPALDTLHNEGTHKGWWFLRKHPCWRLRLHNADRPAIDRALDDLATAGHIARWWPTIYEPETAAFGGTTGMTVVHDLFCADSRGVLGHLCDDRPGLGRRELSILLLTGLFHGAGLDAFERGDVFDRVAQLRPTPPGIDVAKIDQLAGTLHTVVSLDDPARTDLFDSGEPAAHAVDWLAAFQHSGHQLGDAAAHGQLGRGLRAILTHVVIFHWNRLGLSAASQAVLARAATTALLPRE